MTFWTVAILVPGLAIAAACEWSESISPPPQNANQSETAARPPGHPDAWLTTQVQARYFANSMLRGSDVDVSSESGVVTLSGTVPSEAARAQAIKLAQQVNGVTRVQDELDIKTSVATADTKNDPKQPAPPDATTSTANGKSQPTAGERFDAAWTTTKIQAQYFADPDVKGRSIDVTTDTSGRVTLRGRVESEAVRNEALRIAKETEGVREVVDELRIETATGQPSPPTRQPSEPLEDGWITAKIQSKYFLDAEVKGRDIDVDTRDGVVTLSGHVASAAERRQALDIARNTDGVRKVKDQLTVRSVTAVAGKPGGPGSVLETPIKASEVVSPPDGWITTTIQSKFFLSEEVRGQMIDVATARGVVTLQGRVDTDDTKKTAETIARETKGVQRVVNQLTVSEGTA